MKPSDYKHYAEYNSIGIDRSFSLNHLFCLVHRVNREKGLNTPLAVIPLYNNAPLIYSRENAKGLSKKPNGMRVLAASAEDLRLLDLGNLSLDFNTSEGEVNPYSDDVTWIRAKRKHGSGEMTNAKYMSEKRRLEKKGRETKWLDEYFRKSQRKLIKNTDPYFLARKDGGFLPIYFECVKINQCEADQEITVSTYGLISSEGALPYVKEVGDIGL